MAGNATLNFVFDRYMSTKYDLRKTTRSNYNYMYDHFIREGFGMRKIGEIKYSDVKYFYYHLLNECGLQANTVDTIHTILHPTFQLAVRDEIIRINPSDGVMAEIKKKAGKNKGVRHALTVEQQRAFMEYTANNPVYCHWLPLFTVLLGTGCRIGEIVGLRWEDLDYENRTISINHSVTYYPREGKKTRRSEFAVSLPKTEAGIRTVPNFSCHHLRHTFCTRFCENETNIKVIQAVMGHANIETTMDIYAEVTDLKKKEAIENLSQKLDVF